MLILALAATATARSRLCPAPPRCSSPPRCSPAPPAAFSPCCRPPPISDRWGTTHYGRLNGLLSAPAMLATALAPWAGAALAQALGGYPPVFAFLAALATLGAILIAGSIPQNHARP